ncbi:MAG: hypothetical protein H6R07_1573 [Proteobacteria bacterium]|nr:hypothetical protein [Pseudomonadota bacterium]
MEQQTMDVSQQEVWATVEAMNACWTQGDPAGLADFFHPRMIAVTPVARERVEGGAACIAGWSWYANNFEIRAFRSQEPKVEVFGDAAVVSYYFDMEVAKNGVTSHPQGREMYFLVKEDGRWWAVGNSFSANP